MSVSIREITAQAFTFPTATPVESDGTMQWDKTTLVLVQVSAGDQVGIGYTYSDAAAVKLIREDLCPILMKRDPMDIPALHSALIAKTRNLGRPGLASTAIAAVDIALWDLKAKLLKLPLVTLLGRFREEVPIYGSGGFTSYTDAELQEQLGGWVEQGIPRVKMKISGDPKRTLERLRTARLAIGLKTELYVDANGAYSPRQAIALAERMQEHEVTWFEEPVSSDDLEGMAFVRQHVPSSVDVAAGEYGYESTYFDRMIRSGAVDVVQIDATRCLGITGFLQAAALCHALHKPISCHTAPSVHAHLGCAIPEVRHLEYFFDHVRIENLVFDGVISQKNGALRPDTSAPGLGLVVKSRDLQRYAAA